MTSKMRYYLIDFKVNGGGQVQVAAKNKREAFKALREDYVSNQVYDQIGDPNAFDIRFLRDSVRLDPDQEAWESTLPTED
jgi:hypothetical protein